MTRATTVAALLAFAVVGACSDPNAIPLAGIDNVVTTDTIWSIERGTLQQPTAYSLNRSSTVRTWEVGTDFEFLLSFDSSNTARFIPLGGLGLAASGSVKPGLRRGSASVIFDSMVKAPLNGYLTVDSLVLAEGDRFYVRTAVNTCSLYGVPLYAKVEVVDIDTALANVTFKVLSDQNCGYRGLRPGKPHS